MSCFEINSSPPIPVTFPPVGNDSPRPLPVVLKPLVVTPAEKSVLTGAVLIDRECAELLAPLGFVVSTECEATVVRGERIRELIKTVLRYRPFVASEERELFLISEQTVESFVRKGELLKRYLSSVLAHSTVEFFMGCPPIKEALRKNRSQTTRQRVECIEQLLSDERVVRQCTALTSQVPIAIIPPQIGKLTYLQFLLVECSDVCVIPREIELLQQCTHMEIITPSVESLPDVMLPKAIEYFHLESRIPQAFWPKGLRQAGLSLVQTGLAPSVTAPKPLTRTSTASIPSTVQRLVFSGSTSTCGSHR